MPRALITGITGQDGGELAELLAGKGYEIFGMVRNPSTPASAALLERVPTVRLVVGDLRDSASLREVVAKAEPDEVYNLGAHTDVARSREIPEETMDVTGMGVVRLLEAVRQAGPREARVCQPSSSEMFGDPDETPQTERTRPHPRNPYGLAKTLAREAAVLYRERYGLFASVAITYNHESPRRGAEFVTRKISQGIARIALGLQDELVLGNLDARRDWGWAGDYVRAMWLMLQAEQPDDFVIATGETHSIREFLDVAAEAAGLDSWEPHVRVDERFVRPEGRQLVGDPGKAERVLGWRREVSFPDIVRAMVAADLERERSAAR